MFVAAFAPVLTAAVKSGVDKAGGKVPNALKPVINAAAGAVLAGVLGADPTVGVFGAQLGKSVRDQIAK